MSEEDLASEESANQQDPAGRGARPVQATAVLEHIARSLVETPDSVRVEVVDGPSHPRLNLYVAQGDMGRIIGKRGRMASAIRIVTRAAAARDGVEIDVEFVD